MRFSAVKDWLILALEEEGKSHVGWEKKEWKDEGSLSEAESSCFGLQGPGSENIELARVWTFHQFSKTPIILRNGSL